MSNQLERATREGNLEVGYLLEGHDTKMVAKLSQSQVGTETVDLEYSLNWQDGENGRANLRVKYNGVTWSINFRDSQASQLRTSLTDIAKEKVQAAVDWELAHDEMPSTSQERCAKAQALLDHFLPIIRTPIVQEYERNLKGYYEDIEARYQREQEEKEQKRVEEVEELKQRLKDMPDPIDPLVELVNSVES